MARTANDRAFVRWQGIAREQLGRTANLLIGLATGLLAYESTLLLDGRLKASYAAGLGAVALTALFASVGVGLWCAVNRLRDFRLTAQIARDRERGEAGIEDNHEQSRHLGTWTWYLFWWQVALFGLGAVASLLAVLSQVVASWRVC